MYLNLSIVPLPGTKYPQVSVTWNVSIQPSVAAYTRVNSNCARTKIYHRWVIVSEDDSRIEDLNWSSRECVIFKQRFVHVQRHCIASSDWVDLTFNLMDGSKFNQSGFTCLLEICGETITVVSFWQFQWCLVVLVLARNKLVTMPECGVHTKNVPLMSLYCAIC